MKQLRNLVFATALLGCSQQSGSKKTVQEEQYCNAPDDRLLRFNEEVSGALEAYTGERFCSNILYSSAANQKFGITYDREGPISLGSNVPSFEDDVLFAILSHEYGHLFYNHPYYKPYVDYLREKYLCTDPTSVKNLETQADYFSGVLTAVAGRSAEPYIDFLESISESEFWNQPCVEQYYPSDARVVNFSLGYQTSLDEGF